MWRSPYHDNAGHETSVGASLIFKKAGEPLQFVQRCQT
jgi:hypothetical protein